MLYYLSEYLTPELGALNVFRYHTVRSGGALFTGFLLALLIGPRMFRLLRALKVGQFIKQEHVKDLHELHKGKAGTPTMGGLLIIVSTLLSLFLWSPMNSRVLWAAVGTFLLLGAVGFVDDYIKLVRKNNDGLSARAKFTGQIVVGLMLGAYVVFNPITFGASYVLPNDVPDWDRFIGALTTDEVAKPGAPLPLFSEQFTPTLKEWLVSRPGDPRMHTMLLDELNEALRRRDLYDAKLWEGTGLNGEFAAMHEKGIAKLSDRQMVRYNRLLLESAAPDLVVKSPRNLHTKVAVPGIKGLFIPMGATLYILFVMVIIVGTSNAVNLTDGLDGLAIGASVVSISAFTVIAYVVSRADWSSYLYLTHIPEASELTVFGAALLGTGLGFLWFNAHPAEIFMGDTGSLALGGVVGAMAVLTKQELLLPMVGGLFVLEALSVIIQVASFKLTGKRVFRMAPLHHHFELMGWSESKVTIRFWILAFVFALLSLSTLKLR